MYAQPGQRYLPSDLPHPSKDDTSSCYQLAADSLLVKPTAKHGVVMLQHPATHEPGALIALTMFLRQHD